MSNLLSQFLGSSSSKTPDQPAVHTFLIRANPRDTNTVYIHPDGYPLEATPLYTIHSSKSAKPNLVFHYGYPLPQNVIGDATFSSWSSKQKLTLRNMPLEMRHDDLTENYIVHGAAVGKLKWKKPEFSRTLGLYDQSKVKLAHIKSAGTGVKKLEILVQCDSSLIETIILTGLASRLKDKKDGEDIIEALDIASSLAGG